MTYPGEIRPPEERIVDESPLLGASYPDTPRHLANLVFLSYRLSQGGIGTQNRLLLYVENHFQPELFADPKVDEVHALTKKMVGPYFLNQKLHPATAIPWEDDSQEAVVKTESLVTNELQGLFDRFRFREEITGFDFTPADIAASVITMDHDYLHRPGGRGGNSTDLKIVVSPFQRDPFESMYIKYAVFGDTTRSQEFDELFKLLATEDTVRQFDDVTIAQLRSVIKIYTANHHGSATDERIVQLHKLCKELQSGER